MHLCGHLATMKTEWEALGSKNTHLGEERESLTPLPQGTLEPANQTLGDTEAWDEW